MSENKRENAQENKGLKQNLGTIISPSTQEPKWRKVIIDSEIPKGLYKLKEIIYNIWWTWNYECVDLFEMIDEDLWNESGHNPVKLFDSLSYQQMLELENNKEFINKLETIYDKFITYMNRPDITPKAPIAYFSMEYGLTNNLMIYSGGLGVLAGDYLKEASDSNTNMVAIGLLYRYGYFTQQLSLDGNQLAEYQRQKFSKLPVTEVVDDNGHPIKIHIDLPGRKIFARIWKLCVGRVVLYLLDTDINENSDEDKYITHQLYGGDKENRLKQEILLGIGGIRVLRALNVQPSMYHCNEGHAAFIGVERLKNYIADYNISFEEAIELVRSSNLFTTHTPVPAGHDKFVEDLMKPYFEPVAKDLNLSWDSFMGLGRMNIQDKNEAFSMSFLAAKLSQEMNGVSRLHGDVTQEMFKGLYQGYYPDELHIGYVTNGVHYYSWTAPQWQELYKKEFDEAFLDDMSNPHNWEKIWKVPNETIYNIRHNLKNDLIKYLKTRVSEDLTKRQEDPKIVIKTVEAINKDAFIVGFARRFATYKRGYLLFYNLERLAQLVNMQDKPVIFVFAGKAHPHDQQGQDVIRSIVEISKRPEFLGKIMFIENYNIEVAQMLVQGVDLWFNTPTRMMEASGTSGQKAVMNGVLNFSVLDGWWSEGYKEDAGWALSEDRTYEDQESQNRLDAEEIYNVFENEIIPTYFDVNKDGINTHWIHMIKNSIATIAPEFTVKRMLEDYKKHYYSKLINRHELLTIDDFKSVKKISEWKKHIISNWDKLEVESIDVPDMEKATLNLGDKYKAQVTLKLNGIEPDDLGMEVVFRENLEESDVREKVSVESMKLINANDGKITFGCEITLENAGIFDFAIRVFPKNKYLPHKQDLNLIKWI
jgi:phosphorylase/glycogen(starch) synthase